MANVYLSKLKGGSSVNLQASKTVTAGTTQQTFAPDTGYDAMERVVVNPTPSTSITPSSSGTQFSAGLNNMSTGGYAYDNKPAAPPSSLNFTASAQAHGSQVFQTTAVIIIPKQLCALYNYFEITSNNTSSNVIGNDGTTNQNSAKITSIPYSLGSTYDLTLYLDDINNSHARFTVKLYK